MIHEILISVVADDPDRAHEAIVQLAESRNSEVLEVEMYEISKENDDAIDGYCLQARLSGGETT